jgi:hypothetical protein
MAEYKYDVLNDIDSDELLQELGERLGVHFGEVHEKERDEWRRQLTKALEMNRAMRDLLRLVHNNIDAGVEPRHIIRHMESKGDLWK